MFRTRICRQVVVENKEKIRNGVYEDEQEFLGNIAKALFVLAPMEDVTDVVFRHVVKEAGAPDVFYRVY